MAVTSRIQTVSGKQKPFVDDNGDQTIIEKTGNGWETVHERTEPEHPNDSDDDGTQIRQEAMGKKHKIILWLGIAVLWILFELDNATVYNYQYYATSTFNPISLLGALSTAGTIIAAMLKPPVAKISDIFGRAQTYCLAVWL